MMGGLASPISQVRNKVVVFFKSYKELESENISRYKKMSSISLLGMKIFWFKNILKIGMINSLNSNIS